MPWPGPWPGPREEEIDRAQHPARQPCWPCGAPCLDCAPAAIEALIDGNRCPELPIPARAIVKGDASEPCISAASILAKTERDKEMRRLADIYPVYGFDRHAGYPTPEHLAALELHGPSPIHRKSFGPVKRILQKALI
jgi:ribonuclease HII